MTESNAEPRSNLVEVPPQGAGTPANGSPLPPQPSGPDLTALFVAMQPVMPYVKEIAATVTQEATKNNEISARMQRHLIYCVTLLATLVIAVAIIALFMQQVSVTEKIVVGLLGFLGGFGAAKGIGTKNA